MQKSDENAFSFCPLKAAKDAVRRQRASGGDNL